MPTPIPGPIAERPYPTLPVTSASCAAVASDDMGVLLPFTRSGARILVVNRWPRRCGPGSAGRWLVLGTALISGLLVRWFLVPSGLRRACQCESAKEDSR